MPHICWFLEGNEVGGVCSAVVNLLTAVRDKAGWEVSAICVVDGKMAHTLRHLGVSVGVLDFAPPPKFSGSLIRQLAAVASTPWRSRKIARAAERALPAGQPDVIHAQHSKTIHAAGAFAQRIKAHAIWEMPNIISNRAMGLNRLFYQATCWRYGIEVLANSEFTGRTFGRLPRKATTFYLGVDANRFDPSRHEPVPRSQLGVPPDVPLFVIAARIVPEKGQRLFCQAMLEASRDAYLLLLGGPIDSGEARAIRELAESPVAGGRIIMVGQVAYPERYVLAADIAVNSRIDAEPFGLSIIEAMMLGKPVLTHALGGPAETVVDGISGWHIKEASRPAFVGGIRRALDARSDWSELGRNGRERALAQFTSDSQLQRYRAIVLRLMARE